MTMRLPIGMICLLSVALCAPAAVTWEAHWNNGTKSADYAAYGDPDPWSGQMTAPLLSSGGANDSGCIESLKYQDPQHCLSYPSRASEATPNVNVLQGTVHVWFKPNFDSTGSSNCRVLMVTDRTNNEGDFIQLYWRGGTDMFWRWNFDDGSKGTSTFVDSASPTFDAETPVEITLTWTNDLDGSGDGNDGQLKMYIDGELETTVDRGTWGAWNPWALQIGHRYEGGGNNQADGLIDDVIFSDVYDDPALIPEPATCLLVGAGGILGLLRRRK